MGGVAVLHPQDCIKEPFMSKRRSRNPDPKGNRTNRRKRSPTGTGGSRSSPPARAMVIKIPAAKDLVMGQVKILKRGEDFNNKTTTSTTATAVSDLASDVKKIDNNNNNKSSHKDGGGDPGLQLTDRLGPDPAVVAKQVAVLGAFYAGSACITSPPPSSLPLPGFFSKSGSVFAKNKAATGDLLRMLRLNLT